jgi:hypothetical protein
MAQKAGASLIESNFRSNAATPAEKKLETHLFKSL